jgi:hypothetical protein
MKVQRRGSSALSLTSVLDGGGWSRPRSGRINPGNDLVESQGRSGRVRKISPPPVFDPRTIQPVASRYTEYAITAHIILR